MTLFWIGFWLNSFRRAIALFFFINNLYVYNIMIKKFEEFIFESYKCKSFEIRKRSDLFLLTESQESESQKSAIKLVMDRFGWDKERANHFVRIDLRNDITSLRDKQIGKFTLGVTRMYVDGELNDANTISDINATLKLLSAHLNEYDRNLNGLSADELISKFKKVRENNVENEKREISKIKFGVSDYEIVKIDSFSDAKKYYKYTNPSSRWCLTHMKDMYNSYTCNGINQIYFCLRNGFENIKPTVGENTPLDEYGLSMLSIIVNENGELAYCTCRWNHDNGGSDDIMNAVEISKVVNVDFYETFKPNTKWKDMIDDVKNRLANGESLKKVFGKVIHWKNGINIVKLKGKNGRYNLINSDGDFLLDKWFDDIMTDDETFKNGCVRVFIENKGFNLINSDGDFLLDKWFYNIKSFINGYAIVRLDKDGKNNYINRDGKFLSDDGFDVCGIFENDYAPVRSNGKWNYINTDGKYLSDEWFDAVQVKYPDDSYDYDHIICTTEYDKHTTYYKNIYGALKNGCVLVILNGKWNYINTDGEYLSDEWFDFDERYKPSSVLNFNCGYGPVYIESKGYNFINTDGKYLSDEWFDKVFDANEGYFGVRLDGKWNFINVDGEYLSDKWFDTIYGFKDGYALVSIENKGSNFINTDGEYLYDEWFDDARTFSDGYASVKLDGKWNFINVDGEYLSDEWFDSCSPFYKGYGSVELNNKRYFINTDGVLYYD